MIVMDHVAVPSSSATRLLFMFVVKEARRHSLSVLKWIPREKKKRGEEDEPQETFIVPNAVLHKARRASSLISIISAAVRSR